MTDPVRIILYRADKRDFAPGEPIVTAGQFSTLHPDSGKRAEAILDDVKPEGKPHRKDCLMLFESEDAARKHWSKMSNGKLYEVEIDAAKILHRGDMNLVDEIGALIKQGDDDQAHARARDYWLKTPEAKACIEVLIGQGQVKRLIGDNAARIEEFRKRAGIPKYTGEDEYSPWLDEPQGPEQDQ